MSHTISILVEHKPGVLQKVTSLFTRRGFNIESITVGSSEVENLARMVIVVNADEKGLEQVKKQLNKLIDVIKVKDLAPQSSVKRELCLIKVKTKDAKARTEVMQYTDIFRGNIIDVSDHNVTIEVTGHPNKIEALIKLLKNYGIRKIARTGPTALSRGSQT